LREKGVYQASVSARSNSFTRSPPDKPLFRLTREKAHARPPSVDERRGAALLAARRTVSVMTISVSDTD
jgi:hypothetical protein